MLLLLLNKWCPGGGAWVPAVAVAAVDPVTLSEHSLALTVQGAAMPQMRCVRSCTAVGHGGTSGPARCVGRCRAGGGWGGAAAQARQRAQTDCSTGSASAQQGRANTT
jgi:hypothetical protein